MSWLLLGLICVLFAWMAVVVWRKWVAPWQQIEQLVARIRDRQRPSTFLVNGGTESKTGCLALENIFSRQQGPDRPIAGGESGTQTILCAMEDGLVVVGKRPSVTLVYQAFSELLCLPE